MGYGQYTGNKSVHWSVMHEDDKGQEVKLSSEDRASLASAEGPRGQRGQGRARPRPGEPADVGKRKGHSGRFRVRLRFERMQDAREAAAAAQNVMFEDGMYVLVLDVPVIQRASADDPPPSEVRVDW